MADEKDKAEMAETKTVEQDSKTKEQAQPPKGRDDTNAADLLAELEQLKAEQARTAKALKEANSEAAERRKKLEAYEAAEQKRKEAELSELELAQKKAEEADRKLAEMLAASQRMAIESALIAEAAKLNFADPSDVVALLSASVEIDEDGKPKGVPEAVKALSEAKPYMLKQPTKQKAPQPGTTNPDGSEVKQGETYAQKRLRILGGPRADVFTNEFVEQHGGGVLDRGAKQ